MKVQFWSVGKNHDTYFKEAIDDYTKRASRYFNVEWRFFLPVKNAASLSQEVLKKKEAEQIIAAFTGDEFVVLLDEKGKMISSVKLSEMVQQKANEGIKSIIFLIGGAFGVDESLKKKSGFIWSLSDLVFPHMLVRLILAEQFYRACTILQNEKYHHS